MGAVAPSSRALARAMTSIVPSVSRNEAILELGAGTGVITRSIEASWPANRILAVEKNPRLAARLRKRFPRVEIVQGCVSETLGVLSRNGARVGAVISGLPMLSFEEIFRDRVLAAIHHALAPSAFYVQFTYISRAWRSFAPAGFELVATRRVLKNFPPATILCFQKVDPCPPPA